MNEDIVVLNNIKQKELRKKLDVMELSNIEANLSQSVYGASSTSKAKFVADYVAERKRKEDTDLSTRSIDLAEEANDISKKANTKARFSSIVSVLALVVSILALLHRW